MSRSEGWADGGYSRVYWKAVRDPKFVGVWASNDLLAWWLRLLVEADRLYPDLPYIPAAAGKFIPRLVTAGLVDPVGDDRYRIHGLEAERIRRSEHGKLAARKRWSNGV